MIVKTMSEYFNFTYYFIDYNYNFGIKLENNTWTGIFGDLGRKVSIIDNMPEVIWVIDIIVMKQADFAITNLFVTNERTEVVEYTYPYTTAPIVFTSPSPQIRDSRLNLIEPFDFKFWIVLLFIIAVNTGIDFLIYSEKFSTVWTLTCVMMKQPVRLDRDRRFMISSWLLMSIVITGSYAGVIFSLMATSLEGDRIESLSQLVEAHKANKISIIAHTSNPIIKAIKVIIIYLKPLNFLTQNRFLQYYTEGFPSSFT